MAARGPEIGGRGRSRVARPGNGAAAGPPRRTLSRCAAAQDRHSRPPHPAVAAPRDRRGRGIRGGLAPRNVPLHALRAAVFDDFVLDAVEDLEAAGARNRERRVRRRGGAAARLTGGFDADTVSDRGVPLGPLHRSGLGPVRRPARRRLPAPGRGTRPRSLDCGDLVFSITELVAELLGKDVDDRSPQSCVAGERVQVTSPRP